MQRSLMRRWILVAGGIFAVWLFAKYLLPVLLPFGFGLLLAMAAEPAVKTGTKLLKLPRWAASGAGVALTLALLVAILGLLGAALVKELGSLAGRLPDLEETARQSTESLRLALNSVAEKAPTGIRPVFTRWASRLDTSGEVLAEQVAGRLPGAISGFLGRVPDGAFALGTGLLSAFMFSARLPRLKGSILRHLPEKVRTEVLPMAGRVKTALFGWIKAQIKLSAVTFAILLTGFLLLRIPFAPLWALLIALVDAVPILGTGTVLGPWALVALVQGNRVLALGLVILFAVSALTRTVLEPRIMGHHLGVDPLLTLILAYLGFRFWGFLGIVLTPMLAAALLAATKKPSSG